MNTLEQPISRVDRRKLRTRKALLGVALELFAQKGIYWTKIEDITEQADVGKGTFYQYFETKEVLLGELLAQGLDELLDGIRTALAGVSPGQEALEALIQAELDYYLEHPEFLLLFHQVRGFLQLKRQPVEHLRQIYTQHLDKLGQVLEKSLNGKALRPKAAREMGIAVSAYCSSMLTFHMVFEGADLRRNRSALAAQLVRSTKALF